MKFEIDVSHNIINQFSAQLNIDIVDQTLTFPSHLGVGQIELLQFPMQIELYHFKFKLLEMVELQSINPQNSDWLLFNINLSKAVVEKTVNNQKINLQKFLPSGVLLYTPETNVFSKSPKGLAFEIVLIRVHKDFFNQYQSTNITELRNSASALLYEDLDYMMESALQSMLKFKANKIRATAFLMQFLADISDKLSQRDLEINYEQLHPLDVKGLFMAAAHLRNPVEQNIPSIKDLAAIAGMGTTKFKATFKQVFGKAPIQYHQKIKFDYARKELANKRKTASELSYELGYSHPSKFTSAFKKIFGEVPSALSRNDLSV